MAMNRKQKRAIAKKYGQSAVRVIETIEATKYIDDRITKYNQDRISFSFFPEGTKVKLVPERLTHGNPIRDRWMEKHIDEIFTIEYDPKWGPEPVIYCLKEDTSDPKWYFTQFELQKYEPN